MPFRFRVVLIAVMLSALPATVWAQTSPTAKPGDTSTSAAPPQTGAPAAPVHVDGFRSAKWGMTEAQVKAAVHSDFNIAEDKLNTTDNLAEKTQVVSITVPNLLEGAGTAQVTYILGYTSKKLIQVNILWSSVLDPQTAPQKIVAAADQLRVLLLGEGYDPQTIATNARTPDGSLVVFEGQDADKHTTVLRLASGTVTPPDSGGKPGKPVDAAALTLSYILSAQDPDIYRIKKGQF
jgi:FlaG/FlaF family flagellin (archaellin)